MTSLAYLSDPDDPRVKAALGVECQLCKAPPGAQCGWPIGPRLIHEIRIPEKVLFGGAA